MDSTTESGSLAEWSQKIKNLQQQVNEDGLQEQARLEAEIARSRMERANRRSTLSGNARIDQATASYLSRLPERSPEQEPRADALQRLQGATDLSKSTMGDDRSSTPTSRGNPSQPSVKGISLAEFMGGRATGPRLNKHAPQAAYEDHAADYDARNRTGSKSMLQQVSVPSPFALHGLASEELPRKISPAPSRSQTDHSNTLVGGFEQKPPMQVSATNGPPTLPQSPPCTSVEARTKGTITGPSPPLNGDKPVFRRETSPAPSTLAANVVKASASPSSVTSAPWATPSTLTPSRWTSPISPTLHKSPPSSNASPSTSSPRVEMLARPVQPSPSPVQRFIPATNPSPAFLKPGPPKEERPSITRLQGRGFVEKQIKASARLSSTPEEVGKVQRPATAEKKISVLERWPGDGGKKPTSPGPTAIFEVPKRDFRRSLPSGTAPPGPMRVAAFVAATNEKNTPRTRNPEHDSTPLRLPGMGNAGSLPFKSRSHPDPGRESGVSSETSIGSIPRKLPGLAVDMGTPSALKKSSSSTDLRTPSKRRSVHFDDVQDDESFTPKVGAFDGNQTDTANSKKLVHMTKDRARKPRKAGTKSSLSVETAHTSVEDTTSEFPAPQEEKRVITLPEKPVKSASEIPAPKPTASLNTTIVAPPSTCKVPSDTNAASTQFSGVPAPVTPVSARPSSREGRAKLPPPIVAPKPAALRRNSLPTPTEKIAPSFPKQHQARSQPENAPASNSYATALETPKDVTSPALEGTVEDAIPASISVRAAASSWGKPTSNQPAESEQPSISREIDALKQAVGALDHISSSPSESSEPPIVVPTVLNPPVVPMPQPRPRPISQSSERRRSISNRYSAIILPPLKEEKTPAATPEGSLRIHTDQEGVNVPSAQALRDSLASASIIQEPLHRPERPQSLEVVEPTQPKDNGHSPISPLDRTVVIAHEDGPIPAFNLSRLLASVPATPKLAPGAAISIEAFTVSGSASTAIKENMDVLYDGEIVAIVYRGKSKTTGLVATTVWAWIGSKARLGEKETAKLQDMASRFNTSLVRIPQGKEPYDMVQLLGGTIAIRHGSRSHWSSDNTALHCVRMHGSHFVVIEENELMSRNICSAFSYCLAILDALFIWHGRGSVPAERAAAQAYAKTIASEGVEPTELEEGEEDDMFWMMLDEGGYANADYWRFRSQLPPHMSPTPRLWIVSNNVLQPIIPYCASDLTKDSVLMYDGVFELFVLVGEDARGRRDDIRLAVAAAESVAAASAVTRSFPPPMHVLIFPTRVPVDLKANFRGMDQREAASAGSPPPDHINLLTLEEARSQLEQQEWTLRQLNDPQFLPLAISPAMHPDVSSSL